MQEDDKLATTDEEIIAEAIEFRRLCLQFNSDNIANGKADLEFLAGKQLDTADILSRTTSGRPIIQINKLPTFLHQVCNDNLENTPSIKVHPVDDDADEEIAEVLGGIIKNIEYSSNADTAYDTAVNFAVAIGFGYFRVITDFCDEKSFDQDIKIARIANPFSVHFDYASVEPDGSDAMRVLIETITLTLG
jgi:Phage P22-like portal protein